MNDGWSQETLLSAFSICSFGSTTKNTVYLESHHDMCNGLKKLPELHEMGPSCRPISGSGGEGEHLVAGILVKRRARTSTKMFGPAGEVLL